MLLEESREKRVESSEGRNEHTSTGSVLVSWRTLWPYVALAGLVVLFFNQMVFTDLILARGDTFLYFYPYWQMAADALRVGEIPFWNPHIFMGAPLIANSQVGFWAGAFLARDLLSTVSLKLPKSVYQAPTAVMLQPSVS